MKICYRTVLKVPFIAAMFFLAATVFLSATVRGLRIVAMAGSDVERNDRVTSFPLALCSVSLDIIGKAIFNYDFGSVTKESPVIQSVYSVLKEAEHRSMTPAPYWEIPLANTASTRMSSPVGQWCFSVCSCSAAIFLFYFGGCA